jgi:amidophosphoribosyltransferase
MSVGVRYSLWHISHLAFFFLSDVQAGEAIFIDMDGNCHSRVVHPNPDPSPCIFEYVYFARPDSIMDGVSVYETRLKMGEKLADKIIRKHPNHDVDVVIPIPDTSRTSALQAAYKLDRPFREGFIKNRYIARTFIMPGQATRRKSVRLKLNTIKSEFAGKNVLLVDDSIVRGTTANEIVQMARDAGAKKVFFCSAAPPIRYPNIYGIDIPTREELIAFERNEEEISEKIGCDWVVYQDLNDLEDSIKEATPLNALHKPTKFDSSCFSGDYVTGEKIGDSYFTKLYDLRNDAAKQKRKRGTNGGSFDGDSDGGGYRKPEQSHNGCEPLSNDKTESASAVDAAGDAMCESIANKSVGLVR